MTSLSREDNSAARPSGPRVLVVLPDVPLLEGGAAGKYFVALLRGLQANGVDVQAIAARQFFTPPGEMPSDLPVEIVEVEQPPRWQSRARRVLRPKGELSWGRFKARVDEKTRTADLLHLETIHAAWTDHRLRIPSTIHFHYLAGLDRPYGAPWSKQFWQVAEETLAERTLTREHLHLVASSPVVAREVHTRAPRADVTVSPLCLVPDHYPPAAVEAQTTAGFIGTAAWPPTASALGRLLGRIWPAIMKEIPDASLAIAGRGTQSLAPSPPAGVQMLGQVPSGAEFVHGLGVLLYPLERGSGMKVKVLEALATGVPVVTSPAGAEGVLPNPGVIVVEDDAAMVAATVSLLKNEGERIERGSAARETFRTHYTPAVATAPLVPLYAAMAAQG